MGGILVRWESNRSEEADQEKIPLLNSYERGNRTRNQRRGSNIEVARMVTENDSGTMGIVGKYEFPHRRRPAMESTEDLGA